MTSSLENIIGLSNVCQDSTQNKQISASNHNEVYVAVMVTLCEVIISIISFIVNILSDGINIIGEQAN